MNLEETLKTAIEMEEKVQRFYSENASRFNSSVATKIFNTLAKEEAGHVDYLKAKRDKWLKTGKIEVEKLNSVIPAKEMIESKLQQLAKVTDQADVDKEVDVFKQAQELELQISNFYKKMVDQLPSPEKGLFAGFLEIEECHEAIIQAEISSAIGSGVWFDFMEFDQEAG